MTGYPGADGEDPLPAWQRAAAAFTAAVDCGRLDLPLPGSGATWPRWAVFADIAGEDLSVVRLCEGHADEIDADPLDQRGQGPLRALRARALGAGPLSHDAAHSRAVADLTVYLRQHHAEKDLARLGEPVAGQGADW